MGAAALTDRTRPGARLDVDEDLRLGTDHATCADEAVPQPRHRDHYPGHLDRPGYLDLSQLLDRPEYHLERLDDLIQRRRP